MMPHVNFLPLLCKIVHGATFFVFICSFNSLASALESSVIAVIDSGLDASLPKAPDSGWNFFDATPDTLDEINHGSAIAKEIMAVNPAAKFLPVKITRKGDGITPEILAKAIRFSVEKKAKFINLSFALSKGSPELKAAVDEAIKNNVIIVTAAGIGLENPYEPVDVAKIFPQAYAGVFVVGKAVSCSEASADSNFGKKIDFVIPEGETQKRGSSYTAARALGLLSLVRNKNPDARTEELRKKIKPFIRTPQKKLLNENKTKNKMGQGCLDSQKLIEAFK